MNSPIRVLVVDDHASVREALNATLEFEPDIDIVGEASDGREAVQLAQQIQPDVILMDTRMPVMDGLEATRRIVACCPNVRVIGLSMYPADLMVQTMLRAGAAGYIEKSVSLELLVAAIRGAQAGQQERAETGRSPAYRSSAEQTLR